MSMPTGSTMRVFRLLPLAVVLACHPSAEEFAGQDLEAQQYKKKLGDESQKAADLEAKVKSLEARVSQLSSSQQKLEQTNQQLEQKSGQYEQLASSLKNEIETGKIELSELKGKMTVKMKD